MQGRKGSSFPLGEGHVWALSHDMPSFFSSPLSPGIQTTTYPAVLAGASELQLLSCSPSSRCLISFQLLCHQEQAQGP